MALNITFIGVMLYKWEQERLLIVIPRCDQNGSHEDGCPATAHTAWLRAKKASSGEYLLIPLTGRDLAFGTGGAPQPPSLQDERPVPVGKIVGPATLEYTDPKKDGGIVACRIALTGGEVKATLRSKHTWTLSTALANHTVPVHVEPPLHLTWHSNLTQITLLDAFNHPVTIAADKYSEIVIGNDERNPGDWDMTHDGDLCDRYRDKVVEDQDFKWLYRLYKPSSDSFRERLKKDGKIQAFPSPVTGHCITDPSIKAMIAPVSTCFGGEG